MNVSNSGVQMLQPLSNIKYQIRNVHIHALDVYRAKLVT